MRCCLKLLLRYLYLRRLGLLLLALLALLLFWARPANAQQAYLRQFGPAEGFQPPFVYALLQDRQGYLWLGTGDGLLRYDGSRIVTFTTKEGLAEDFVVSLYEEPATGRLWVGHYLGGISVKKEATGPFRPANRATAPAGPFTYEWHMGDGTTLTGPTVTYCYKERKNYVVQLDVIVGKTGEVRRGQKYIPVNLLQQDIVDFTAQPSRVRVGQAVSFAAPEAQLLTCGNVQLIWDFRDGTIVQGLTAQHTFRRTGTYAVRFSMRGYGSQACVASHCVSREIVVEP